MFNLQKLQIRNNQTQLLNHTSCRKESSNIIHFPCLKHVVSVPAVIFAPLQPAKPKWQVNLILEGPVCGIICVPGKIDEKQTMPPSKRDSSFSFSSKAKVLGHRCVFSFCSINCCQK